MWRSGRGEAYTLFSRRVSKLDDSLAHQVQAAPTPAKARKTKRTDPPLTAEMKSRIAKLKRATAEELSVLREEQEREQRRLLKKEESDAYHAQRGKRDMKAASAAAAASTPKKVREFARHIEDDIEVLATPPRSRSSAATSSKSKSEKKPRKSDSEKSSSQRKSKSDNEESGDDSEEYDTPAEQSADEEDREERAAEEDEDELEEEEPKEEEEDEIEISKREIREMLTMTPTEVMSKTRQVKKADRMTDSNKITLLEHFRAAIKKETGGDGSTSSFNMMPDGTITKHTGKVS